MTNIRRLSMLLYGDSGVGKTPFSNSAPGPRLMFDVEGASQWLKNPVVYWDGKSNPNQLEGITPDTTVVVKATNYAEGSTYQIVRKTMEWLESTKHPFRSVILDSLTELQLHILSSVAGTEKRDYDAWGKLLMWCEDLALRLKELPHIKGSPVDAVIVICGAEVRDDKTMPLLDGGIRRKIAFKFDLLGYLYRDSGPDNIEAPHLRIQPLKNEVAKDRTQILAPHYGPVVLNPDIMDFMRVLNQPTEAANG